MNSRASSRNIVCQAGFSLVELMVAVTLGLLVTAGLVTLFVANSRTSAEIEKANRQIENGRYAAQLLTEELRLAGFLGEFDPTVLPTPTVLPDPCTLSLAGLKAALPLHVQGYDNVASSPLSCVTEPVVSGTDILVIRRASTCAAGSAGCDAVTAGTPYFQASLCRSPTQLGSGNPSDYYALDWVTANLTRQKNDCLTTNLAALRRYRTDIYFIAQNDIGSDGIPTLKRVELGPDTATGQPGFSAAVPLVEGVDNIQIEYGIDTTNNGAPDAYTADPGTYLSCAGAACVTNWRNVVAVKLNILVRNTKRSQGYTDRKTYALGSKADGTVNLFGPYNDGFKRHVFQTVVRLDNPSGRKEP